MNRTPAIRALVGLLVAAVYCIFAFFQSAALASPHDRLVFWSGTAFALLVLFRRNPSGAPLPPPASRRLATCAVTGTLLSLGGTVADVHQFQWLGLLQLVYAGLRWCLPDSHGRNLPAALFVLYWAHPLPANLFAAVRLAMQRLSVDGAEWVLHAIRIPVWADGILLRTGERVFAVPEACSGMNTAAIVLVCALGSGALVHLSLGRRLILLVAGLAQVLALNSVRIAAMVALSADKPTEWSDRFIHDSTSALMLTMIVLIQAEAWLWSRQAPVLAKWWKIRWKRRTKHQVFSQPHRLIWQRLEWFGLGLAAVVLLAGAVFMLHRHRPSYRARMVSRVAAELTRHNLDQAQRAADAAARLSPGDPEFGLLAARVELTRGKHQQALDRLSRLQPVQHDNAAIQLTAWGLLGAGRLAEAQSLLARLPPAQVAHPGIAMCSTELAIRRDDVAAAASNVVLAATWPALTERVRSTYPFLALHGQWSAIARTASPLPYRDVNSFRIMLAALTVEGGEAGIARHLSGNRSLWYGKPAFLPHLRQLALQENDPAWQQVYAENLIACLRELDADDLCASLESCFMLARPDLAWTLYRRLAVIEPHHPALQLIPAQFAGAWFAFRDEKPRAVASTPRVQDLRPLLRIAGGYPPWDRLLAQVPLASAMLQGPPPSQVESWFVSGLAEMRRREAAGSISYEQYVLYERSLQAAGHVPEAFDVLDRMERAHPDRAVEILSRRAALYRARDQWQPLYETVRRIQALRPHLDRSLQLTLTETMARLEMGVCALELASEAALRQPAEQSAQLALANIWDQFGHPEEALFALRAIPKLPPSESLADLLWRTGRYAQAARMYALLGHPEAASQRPSALPTLPPADAVLSWPAMAATPFTREGLARQIQSDTSPFLRELHTLTRDWIARGDRAAPADPERWEKCGRDRFEKATALHRLAFLAGRAGDSTTALDALDRALRHLPGARMLWRMKIALSGGAPLTVAAARTACPDDPDIWLADIALRIRNGKVDAASGAVREALEARRFPAAALVRAGYALLKAGDAGTAARVARETVEDTRDYLPACLLGLDAAVAANDIESAVSIALRTADLAPDPLPFFQMAVRLSMSRPASRFSLTQPLEALIAGDPQNPEWRLRLGALYYNQGLYDASHHAFDRWLISPPAGTPASLLILMAESARQSGNLARSIATLREACRRFPEDIHVVNSLAYTLAQSPATLPEARRLLPRLEQAPPTASILDTIAVIHARAGKLDRARATVRQAMAKLTPDDPHWREIHLNAAEIEALLGHLAEAEVLLRQVRRQSIRKSASLEERLASLEITLRDLRHAGAEREK